MRGRAAERRALQWDVLLVGPIPPPFGGVSVHVRALREYLQDEGMRVGVVNHFGSGAAEPGVVGGLRRNPLRYLLLLPRQRASIIHYHHGRWSTLLATAIVAGTRTRAGAQTIATIHGHELEPYLSSRVPFVAALTRWALAAFDELVAVSAGIAARLQEYGVAKPVTVIPAYLPRRDGAGETLGAATQSFVDQAGRLIVVSAYRLQTGASGADLYGIHVAIELFARAGVACPGLALACFVAQRPLNRREARTLDRLRLRIAELGVGDRVRVCFAEPLLPVFARPVLYLRPSETDGDAVSIREALAAGVVVVASDVVGRPEGTVVRGLDDLDGWSAEIERWIAGCPSVPAQTGSDAATAPAERLLALYRRRLTAGS